MFCKNIIEGFQNCKISKKIFEEQADILFSYTRSYAYYEVINSKIDLLSSFNFWIHTRNTHLLYAIIEWCKIFGTDRNESHWKKIFKKESKYFENAVRERILNKAEFSGAEWNDYWKKLCDFRNEYCAHRNPDSQIPVPFMDKSFKAASAYFEFIIALIPWDNRQGDLNEHEILFENECIKAIEKFLE